MSSRPAAALLLSLSAMACGGGSANPTNDEGTSTGAQSQEEVCKESEERTCGSSSSGTVTSKQRCVKGDAGAAEWGPCETQATGGSSTPLVLVFDGAAVEYGVSPGATFDIAGENASRTTDWPTARTPWLALDRNGNGRIDDGGELFGSMTRLSTGLQARHGFEALAELDENHDGAITAADPAFAKLVVWSDSNGDRVASDAEQKPASESLVRIELAYRRDPRCNATGNCEIERASFLFRDSLGGLRTGEIVDVHLRHR